MNTRFGPLSYIRIGLGLGTASIALVAPMAAAAQVPQSVTDPAEVDQAADDSSTETAADSSEIVVTGTLLRGIAPIGTNVVVADQEDIAATGATSTNDVLTRIPQITNRFNTVAISSGNDAGTTTSRPNIRNLGASGTNTTLVLVDGHRVVGVGTLQTTPDPDVVPPGVLERVEIVPDGGSSIYGSDAIGGVINLITRKRFDGVEVAGRYGFADNYYQYDVNVTAGRDWGSGSLYASYVNTRHDAIFGRDRDYVQQIAPSNACAPGTVTVGAGTPAAQTYALPALAAGTRNTCDVTDNASIVPAEQRHSVFAGLTQDLSDALTFELKAFYTTRETNPYTDQFRSAVTITSANPFFRRIGTENSQTVAFSYAPVFGPSNKIVTQLDEWGVTPTFTAELGGGWQLRALGNYGNSVTSFRAPALNTTLESAALGGLTTATALNPYDPTQTNPTVLAGIRNFESYARSQQELANGRVVLDGSLFELPGGSVRLAAGSEVIWESYRLQQAGTRVVDNNAALFRGQDTRTVTAVFGEVAVPIFGAGNGFAGMESLTLSASGRYDHYTDIGGTFNPKFGLTYKPVSWISLRGNYGTSFNAPSLADTGAAAANVTVAPIAVLSSLLGSSVINPALPAPSVLRSVILVAGGNPDLTPQEAETYSIGADISPPFIDGLRLSATYYNVEFTNQISIAFGSNLYAPGLESFYVNNPTLAQVTAVAGTAPVAGAFFNGSFQVVPATSLAAVFATPFTPYLLANLRRNNLGSVKIDGIDFDVSYVRPTSFGSVNASVAGTYTLNRDVRLTPTSPVVDALATNASRFNLVAGLGATVGNFSAQATLYHNDGYQLTFPAGTQTRVDGYDTVDLFFAYDVNGGGLFNDLSFTLNVNNVFDNDPPFLNSGAGYANGATLGRLVQFGIRKKF